MQPSFFQRVAERLMRREPFYVSLENENLNWH
jgi:hypothetical protein